MLTLTEVEVRYGAVRAVRDLTLTVGPREIVALLGANGAGKTTTLGAISGLLRPSHGTIHFGDVDITARSTVDIVKLGVVHVPQGRRIFGSLSVHENLQLGGYTLEKPAEVERRIRRIYDLLPVLAERRRQAGGTLSGGEQQLLAIGRALIPNHQLLLLDEPSMGLAPMMVRTVLDLVRELNRTGTSVLLVEQNARAALRLAHRGYVLEVGRVTLTGPALSLRGDPRVTDAYLGG